MSALLGKAILDLHTKSRKDDAMINTLLIILIITIGGIAFNIQSRNEVRRRRLAKERMRLESLKRHSGDARTIDLIGEDAYHEMTERIQDILDRHCDHQCLTLDLTCGPDTIDGAHELHRLLPGNQLQLINCSEGGVETIDVYYNGSRIGRLALLDAMTIKEIMQSNHIRGAYVSEQNCYGIPDSCQLSLIIFYEPIEVVDTLFTGKSIITGSQKNRENITSADICQN